MVEAFRRRDDKKYKEVKEINRLMHIINKCVRETICRNKRHKEKR